MVKHLEAFQAIADANGGTLFGGTAGMTMHPTYHTAADRLDTVNMTSLDDMADAGAHAILWFAMDGNSEGRDPGWRGRVARPLLRLRAAYTGRIVAA